MTLAASAPADLHVQNHVDEMPFGWRHLKVWGVSAAGLMMAGYSFFMIGIVLPLMQKDPAFPITTFEAGAIAAAGILGTLLGAGNTPSASPGRAPSRSRLTPFCRGSGPFPPPRTREASAS
jgi:hypothetical protein